MSIHPYIWPPVDLDEETTMQVDGKQIDYSGLPEHMQEGMKLYIERGVPPGGFLTAVLSNDLLGACGKADDVNRHRLFDYAYFLYNHAPPACFGSADAVRKWIESYNAARNRGDVA